LLLFVSELRASADEVLVVTFEQEARLRIKTELFLAFVERLDSAKQSGIEENGIALGSELGSHLGFDLLQRGIGMGRIQVRKDAIDPFEQLAGAFQGDDRVFERRLALFGGDRFDVLELVAHPAVVGREEMIVFDPVERRQMKWEGALDQQRCFGGGCGIGNSSNGTKGSSAKRHDDQENGCARGLMEAAMGVPGHGNRREYRIAVPP
jgi:hypothetical protein